MTNPHTVADVAAMLQCSEDVVRSRALELCGVKFGRDWVFPVEAFHEALNRIARAQPKKAGKPPSAVIRAVGMPEKKKAPALP